MNAKPPKSYPDKPKNAPKPSQGYPVTQNSNKPEKKKNKPHYSSKRYRNETTDSNYYPSYKRKQDLDVIYIYKQDLIQKGFQVYSQNKPCQNLQNLCDQFPECFSEKRRQVIIDAFADQNDELSMASKSRIQGRDELREDLEHLMDNEEIPDWYFDPTVTEKTSAFFDFSSTVNRTKEINKDIVRQVKEGHRDQKDGPRQTMETEINFEELDKLLEKKFISAKKEESIDEEALEDLEAFESDNEERSSNERNKDQPGHDSPQLSNSKPPRKNSDSLNDSKNESTDYFFNLQNNIKKMLFNKEESLSEEDKDSEESFQESLGFESNRDRKTTAAQQVVPDNLSNVKKVENGEGNKILTPYEQKPILPNLNSAPSNIEKTENLTLAPLAQIYPLPLPIPFPPNFQLPPLPLPPQRNPRQEFPQKDQQKLNLPPLNYPHANSVVANLPLNKLELENPIINLSKIEEYKNITPEEREVRKVAFLDRYGYLDPIMCQIVYEILNSKQRQNLNKYSINGFNQKSVENYCQNKYKIFSLYMQGDIISKVWLYKDKLNQVQGPFMSYDMDIWNGEGNYFAEDLKIALMNSPFLPLQMYQDRAQVVIDVVQNFLLKNEQTGKDSGKFQTDNYKKGNNKKYAFHKKSETEKEDILPQNYKSPEELSSNFTENFPPLSENTPRPKLSSEDNNQAKRSHLSSVSGEPSLLDTLRGTLTTPNTFTEPRKTSNQSALPIQKPEPINQKVPSQNPEANPSRTESFSATEKPQPPKPTNNTSQALPKEPVLETKLQKVVNRKEATPVIIKKSSKESNSQKNSTKKPAKKAKVNEPEPYVDEQETTQYVQKVEANTKAGPTTQTSHNDLTLSIKNMLGLNIK